MKKWITLLLSIFMGVCCLLCGCKGGESGDGGFTLNGNGNGGVGNQVGTPFTVTLKTVDGGEWGSLDGLYAVWTEAVSGGEVFRAPFDEEGVAISYEPDGEYRVTLSGTPAGYTYNPNIYTADNTRRDRTVELYPLREFTGGQDGAYNSNIATMTGAYRFTFEKANQSIYFKFAAKFSGLMIFESLLDVTANEVCPVLYKCRNAQDAARQREIRGGGTSNSFTKNFRYEASLSESHELLFEMLMETVNPKAFPVTIDVLIQKEGEYTQTGSEYQMVPAPTNLVDYSDFDPTAGGTKTFHLLPDENGKTLDESRVAYDENTNQWYLNERDGGNLIVSEENKIYALLARDAMGLFETWTNSPSSPDPVHLNVGLTYPMVRHVCAEVEKNYTQFIQAYFARVNTDKSYPVSGELKEYLYDFCVAQRLFYDGLGNAENNGYSSDGKSRWLFVCGYYA